MLLYYQNLHILGSLNQKKVVTLDPSDMYSKERDSVCVCVCACVCVCVVVVVDFGEDEGP